MRASAYTDSTASTSLNEFDEEPGVAVTGLLERGGGCDLAVGVMVEVKWQQGHAQLYITCKV